MGLKIYIWFEKNSEPEVYQNASIIEDARLILIKESPVKQRYIPFESVFMFVTERFNDGTESG